MVAALRESDLYEPVKAWLERRGWDVYPEVQPFAYDRRADIVGLQGPSSLIVEMKTSLTYEVIQQAIYWIGNAHYIWIAVPMRKVNWLARHYLYQHRIGLLLVDKDGTVTVNLLARFMRTRKHAGLKAGPINWRSKVSQAHKAGLPGGSPGGKKITPYKKMMPEVRAMIENNPQGLTVDEILDHCETHYSAPRPSLTAALRNYEGIWCDHKKNAEGKTIFYATRFKSGQAIDYSGICLFCSHKTREESTGWRQLKSRFCTKKEVCDKLVVIEKEAGVANATS